mmetsp:Transcript_7592/g.10426  ORF Transcript_7592/g.10426 Transcript_7592/m.10426 type:complete len:100 (-) Transcript_7592:187-486(-)
MKNAHRPGTVATVGDQIGVIITEIIVIITEIIVNLHRTPFIDLAGTTPRMVGTNGREAIEEIAILLPMFHSRGRVSEETLSIDRMYIIDNNQETAIEAE